MALISPRSVWSALKFNAGDAIGSMSFAFNSRVLRRFKSNDGELIYKNNRAYKSVLVHAAKRLAVATVSAELKKIIPRYKREIESALQRVVRTHQEANNKILISNGERQTQDYGHITTKEGYRIIAHDRTGHEVRTALILSYDDEDNGAYTYTDVDFIERREDSQIINECSTVTRIHIDLAPEISQSSSKNIVLTQVQGRDYTRKELVSGGDLEFSVSGNIVSNQMGVYPSAQVKRFIQIMQYGGIINVNHLMFGQFNVNRIIIKDFSLGKPQYLNIQPYSFSCVAVEPDEDVQAVADTIKELSTILIDDQLDGWYKVILNKKLSHIIAQGADVAQGAVTSASAFSLDNLTTNI